MQLKFVNIIKLYLSAVNSIILNYIQECYSESIGFYIFEILNNINPDKICGYFGNIKSFVSRDFLDYHSIYKCFLAINLKDFHFIFNLFI